MKAYINESGKPCFKDATPDTEFSGDLFHVPKNSFEDDKSFALHTNLGSLTVVDRMTGFGWRDTESGFRDPNGNFWLASGNYDVRYSGCVKLGDAIEWVKARANTCIPEDLSRRSK